MPKVQVIVLLLLTILFPPLLVVLGQPWWCKCGELSPWSWAVWSSHNSQHFIDPYTFSHILHGFVFYYVLSVIIPRSAGSTRFVICTGIEIFWEFLENSPIVIERYRAATASLDYLGDSALNSYADVLSCLLGFFLASRFKVWQSVMFFIAVELGMLATIRDNLTLNVIMLLHPIEAIKLWQRPV